MATVLLSPVAKQYFPTASGAPAAGYKLFTYAANTTTPQATYTNRAGTVANTNPIILDASGMATIYLTPGVMYDYVLKTPSDGLEWTREDVSADAGDADAVAYNDPLAPAFLKTTSDIINGEPVSVLRNIDKTKWSAIRAGANSDNLYNNFADLLAAMGTQGYGRLDVPRGSYNISTTLGIPAGVTIAGEGRYSTNIKFNAITNGLRLYDGACASDLCVDGLNTSQTGIHADAASRVLVRGVLIQNLLFHGLAITNCVGGQFDDVRALNCQSRGVIIDPNSYDNQLTNIYTEGCTNGGLLIGHNSHHNLVRNLTAINTGNAGLWVHHQAYENKISGVVIRNAVAPVGAPGIFVGHNAYGNMLTDFSVEGYESGLSVRGGPADSGFTSGDTRKNTFSNGRLIGNGSGVAGSFGVAFTSTDAGVTKVTANKFLNLEMSGYASGYYDPAGNAAFDNVIQGGDLTVDVTTKFSLGATSRTRLYNVLGYTPVGSLGGSTPAFPATNVPVTNNFPFPVRIFITGMPNVGTRIIQIGGNNTAPSPAPGDGNGMYILMPQETITPFYGAGTPSWTWFGL